MFLPSLTADFLISKIAQLICCTASTSYAVRTQSPGLCSIIHRAARRFSSALVTSHVELTGEQAAFS
jgi:hypothetical protein